MIIKTCNFCINTDMKNFVTVLTYYDVLCYFNKQHINIT